MINAITGSMLDSDSRAYLDFTQGSAANSLGHSPAVLVAEHQQGVRLWVDDLRAFVPLCPEADAQPGRP